MRAAATLDLAGDVCPITWVKAKVALDTLEAGQVLQVRLAEGQALTDVPRSAKIDGHRVVGVEDNGDGTFTVLIEKEGR